MQDYEQWLSEQADPQLHREYAQEWLRCDTRGIRDAYFKKHGVRWSELLRLPYMDPIRFAVVDPMHCLFLGVAKWIIQSIFVKENKLNSEQLRIAQRRMDSVQLPSDIGRIPPKVAIGEGFSKLTADQWKTFIMIYATTILWDMLDDNDKKILEHFVWACNLLVTIPVTQIQNPNAKIPNAKIPNPKSQIMISIFCRNSKSQIPNTSNLGFWHPKSQIIWDLGNTYNICKIK